MSTSTIPEEPSSLGTPETGSVAASARPTDSHLTSAIASTSHLPSAITIAQAPSIRSSAAQLPPSTGGGAGSLGIANLPHPPASPRHSQHSRLGPSGLLLLPEQEPAAAAPPASARQPRALLEQQQLADSLALDPELEAQQAQALHAQQHEEAHRDALEQALELELQQLDEARAVGAGTRATAPARFSQARLASHPLSLRGSAASMATTATTSGSHSGAAEQLLRQPSPFEAAASPAAIEQGADPGQALRSVLAGLGAELSPQAAGMLAGLPLEASMELIRGYATGYIDGRCQSLASEGGDGTAQVRPAGRRALEGCRARRAACKARGWQRPDPRPRLASAPCCRCVLSWSRRRCSRLWRRPSGRCWSRRRRGSSRRRSCSRGSS
jgi:hypothetical protein